MEIEIVKPTVDDWSVIRSMRLRAVTEEPYAFGSTKEETLEKTEADWRKRIENSIYFLARDKATGSYLGIVCVVPGEGSKNRHVGIVYSVFGVSEARGQGIGSQLMNALIEEARKTGYKKLRLYAVTRQEAAQRLYESFGFYKWLSINRKCSLMGNTLTR